MKHSTKKIDFIQTELETLKLQKTIKNTIHTIQTRIQYKIESRQTTEDGRQK